MFETSIRRIAHQEESQSFAVLTCRTEVPSDGSFVPTHQSASLLAPNRVMCPEQDGKNAKAPQMDTALEKNIESVVIIDQHTLDGTLILKVMQEILYLKSGKFKYKRIYKLLAQSALQLQDDEWGMSVISCKFENDPETYYCVGTAFVHLEDKEPSKGNIRILKFSDG